MSEPELRTTLEALAQLERGDHPSPDSLLSYQLGELPTELEESIERHLARCPECTRALLDFENFPEIEPNPEVKSATDEEVEALWQNLKTELPPETRVFNSLRFAQAAAILFLATTLLIGGFQVWQLVDTPAPATPPLNLSIFELHPTGARTLRTDEPTSPRTFSKTSDGALVVLVLAETEPAVQYEIVLTSAQGEELWTTRELERTREGLLSFYLKRDYLPPGRYAIQLSGLHGGSSELLARFELHLDTD